MTLSLNLNNTHFLTSAATLYQLPADSGAEVAFVGRSNAGKSSAINKITGRKNLARTSKEPGRTQLINFFAIDNLHRIVDLPGFGYAKVPQDIKKRWQQTLHEYLNMRESLRGIFLIMDSRHPLTIYDEQLIQFLENSPINLHILLTKVDKLTNNEARKTLNDVLKATENTNCVCSVQLFSAHSNLGVEEAQATLCNLLI